MREQLELLAKKLLIRDRITFLGDVADIYTTMCRWDLFCYATTEREGLGNAVGEAMLIGLPCLVTDIGPMREFLGDEGAIELVKAKNPVMLAESIVSLMLDLNARNRLSVKGRQLAKSRFDSKRFALNYAMAVGFCQSDRSLFH
jgi:glycosyltransferase involved in cell wall biosynthesis